MFTCEQCHREYSNDHLDHIVDDDANGIFICTTCALQDNIVKATEDFELENRKQEAGYYSKLAGEEE